MLRVLLAICLLGIAGGIGFYFGRSGVRPVFVPPPVQTDRSRSLPQPIDPPTPPDIRTETSGTPAMPPVAASETHAATLSGTVNDRKIGLPIAGLKQSEILDTFNHSRAAGERRHEATDIMAPRGTPVIAVDSGVIKKLFNSKPGGLTIYQYDPGERVCYYYAHLDSYAAGVREGMSVRRGDLIGYVGSTGNAAPDAPHLHFAILQLGPGKEWWRDTIPFNPYPALLEALPKQQ